MARIRTVKPEFWTSEQVMECSPNARLLFIGMWNFCDDAGIHPASERTLKAEVFPGDDITTSNVRRWIDELLSNGLLFEYSAENRLYWQVTGWKHQRIDRPHFKFPKPNDEQSEMDLRSIDDRSTQEGNGMEGKGNRNIKEGIEIEASCDARRTFDDQSSNFRLEAEPPKTVNGHKHDEPPKPKPKTRRTVIDPDFDMSAELYGWGIERGYSADKIESEFEKFKTYWIGEGKPKADWDATFRTWMMRN